LVLGFSIKVAAYIFFFFWVRATLPRLRVDRLMDFAWKYLVPLAILNILIAAVWYEVVIRPSGHNWLLGWLVTAPLVAGSVLAVFSINRALATSSKNSTVTAS
jgi:NADH-quinone oxidoreductase subunit H